MTTREEVLRLRLGVESDGADNVVVRERVEGLARVGVPDLTANVSYFLSPFCSRPAEEVIPTPGALTACKVTYAEKSALPVTAREASSEIFVDQTAPLWPDISLL